MFYTPGVTPGIFMSSIILASASPQRKHLLEGLGLEFTVIPSQVDEPAFLEADPFTRARELALLKAKDVASRNPGSFVIGCDTLVVASDHSLLEKPVDADDARRMLRLHSGKISQVHSGLAIISPEGVVSKGVDTSDVHFKDLTEAEIEWWIGTGLWKDRSGGFQIDGPGQMMIEWIRGDWSGIVGLPVHLLGVMAKEVGMPIMND